MIRANYIAYKYPTLLIEKHNLNSNFMEQSIHHICPTYYDGFHSLFLWQRQFLSEDIFSPSLFIAVNFPRCGKWILRCKFIMF